LKPTINDTIVIIFEIAQQKFRKFSICATAIWKIFVLRNLSNMADTGPTFSQDTSMLWNIQRWLSLVKFLLVQARAASVEYDPVA
jgi:hypothetical protein